MRIKLTKSNIAQLNAKKRPYEAYDTDLKGFLLRVQPSGKKSFYARYRVGGGRSGKFTRYLIGDASTLTAEEARKEARGKLADAVRGEDPQAARKKQRATLLTVGTFIEGSYKENVLDLHRHKRGAATLARLKNCFETDFWNRPLNDPTIGALIVNWYRKQIKLDEKGNPKKSLATVFRDIGALSAVFSYAVEEDLLVFNPLQAPMRKQRKRLKREGKAIDTGRVRYLSADEETRLMAALDAREERIREERDSHNQWLRDRHREELPDLRKVQFADHLKPMVLLSLYTGVRRGELFGIEWRDIDREQGTLHIRAEICKTGYPRDIPLNPEIAAALAKWREQTAGDGLVFQSDRTGGRFDNVNSAWERVLSEAKVCDFTWHDCRHCFASKLAMAGNDLNRIRDLLGHQNIKTTLRYSHLAPGGTRDAVNVLKFG